VKHLVKCSFSSLSYEFTDYRLFKEMAAFNSTTEQKMIFQPNVTIFTKNASSILRFPVIMFH
jgi:hypothetical protein